MDNMLIEIWSYSGNINIQIGIRSKEGMTFKVVEQL